MTVYLNEISGLWQAITAMYMSKRSWTREKEQAIIEMVGENYDDHGLMYTDRLTPDMVKAMDVLCKWMPKHITLGRFVDFAFTVEGLHRGAQDDFDSHAMRFGNRIIRSSTRLADFDALERSAWYEGRILTMGEALGAAGVLAPDIVKANGTWYVRKGDGYVRHDLADDRDTVRGLYRLSIPSNFTFRVNATEFAHIVKQRDRNSHAHPELREAVEEMKRLVAEQIPQFTEEFWYSIEN